MSSPEASERLGRTLRGLLVSPGRGFDAALDDAEARARAGRRAEGVHSYVLAALGGTGLMVGWLKVSGAAGLRDVPPGQFGALEAAAALVLGAVVALVAQGAFGALGTLLLRAPARELRLVWGAASVPQALVALVLFPLDLVVVGIRVLSTARPGDSVATAWAALTTALCVAAAAWSTWLLGRGVEALGRGRAAGLAVAVASLAAAAGAAAALLAGVAA